MMIQLLDHVDLNTSKPIALLQLIVKKSWFFSLKYSGWTDTE